MAAELPDIVDKIAERLNVEISLRAYAYVPDGIQTPMATVMPEETDYHMSGGALGTLHRLRVQVIVGKVAERATQRHLQRLLSYSGDDSVRGALETDDTLDDKVQQVWVRRAENIGALSTDNAVYLAADFIVEVLA